MPGCHCPRGPGWRAAHSWRCGRGVERWAWLQKGCRPCACDGAEWSAGARHAPRDGWGADMGMHVWTVPHAAQGSVLQLAGNKLLTGAHSCSAQTPAAAAPAAPCHRGPGWSASSTLDQPQQRPHLWNGSGPLCVAWNAEAARAELGQSLTRTRTITEQASVFVVVGACAAAWLLPSCSAVLHPGTMQPDPGCEHDQLQHGQLVSPLTIAAGVCQPHMVWQGVSALRSASFLQPHEHLSAVLHLQGYCMLPLARPWSVRGAHASKVWDADQRSSERRAHAPGLQRKGRVLWAQLPA